MSYQKSDFFISIYGTKRGTLWMPGIEAEKQFRTNVVSGETLREIILRLTNDGDFQSCGILSDTFVRVRFYRGERRIERDFDINSPLFTSIKDCIIDDWPMFEQED